MVNYNTNTIFPTYFKQVIMVKNQCISSQELQDFQLWPDSEDVV